MDKDQNRRYFQSRNPDLIVESELARAAKWWAINATVMPPTDPWKSHMALLPIAALLAVNGAELSRWLENAHKAVSGGLRQTIYADARLELLSLTPPWDHSEFRVRQNDPAFVLIRRGELQRLIDEIRADAQVQASNGQVL